MTRLLSTFCFLLSAFGLAQTANVGTLTVPGTAAIQTAVIP